MSKLIAGIFSDCLNLINTRLNPLRGSQVSVFIYLRFTPEVIKIYPVSRDMLFENPDMGFQRADEWITVDDNTRIMMQIMPQPS